MDALTMEELNFRLEKAHKKNPNSKHFPLVLEELSSKDEGTFAQIYAIKGNPHSIIKVIDAAYIMIEVFKYNVAQRFKNDVDKMMQIYNQYIEEKPKRTYKVIKELVEEKHCEYLMPLEDMFTLHIRADNNNEPRIICFVKMPKMKVLSYYAGASNEQINREIAFQMALGIKELHQNNLIHRDIKPDNVFYTESESGAIHIYLGDFGMLMEDGEESLKSTRTRLNTSYFAPPEANKGTFGHFSDIYSWAATLYILFYKFNVNDISDEDYDQQNNLIIKANKFTGGKASEYRAILQKAIMDDYEKRYHDISDVIYELSAIINKEDDLEWPQYNEEEKKNYREELEKNEANFIDRMKNYILKGVEYISIKQEEYRKYFEALIASFAIKPSIEENLALEEESKIEEQSLPQEDERLMDLYYCIQQVEAKNYHAINNLGCMYAQGRGIKKDMIQAMMYFKQCYMQLSQAQENVKRISESGYDVSGHLLSIYRFEELQQMASENDYGKYLLALYYYRKYDYDQAIQLLVEASESDYYAKRLLCKEYQRGIFINKDEAKVSELTKEIEAMQAKMKKQPLELFYFHY